MLVTTRWYEKRFICEQARRIKARRILEIGAFKGDTTVALSRVAAENGGYVVAIDPMMWSNTPQNFVDWLNLKLNPKTYEPSFWRNVRKNGHDNVTLHRALSTDPALIAQVDEKLAEFDLVFIDGEHSYEGTRADFDTWGVRVRKGGVVLLHDVSTRFPGVMKVMNEVAAKGGYKVTMPQGLLSTVGMVDVN